MSLAAILTCHNRKEKTLSCLDSFFSFYPDADAFLTDDGCTDGTADAIRVRYPQVHIIKGNGSLYWSRGMRLAWQEAIKYDYDYYLWLNDDVVLYPEVVSELWECCHDGHAIVCGIVEDVIDHGIIYSGFDRAYRKILPTGRTQHIHYMNGNVVLIPKSVVERIGIIDSHYLHDLGDYDYGQTAIEHGIEVLSTKCIVAGGYRGKGYEIRLRGLSLIGRLKSLTQPLNSPLKQFFYYKWKHYGLFRALLAVNHRLWINILSDRMYEKTNKTSK